MSREVESTGRRAYCAALGSETRRENTVNLKQYSIRWGGLHGLRALLWCLVLSLSACVHAELNLTDIEQPVLLNSKPLAAAKRGGVKKAYESRVSDMYVGVGEMSAWKKEDLAQSDAFELVGERAKHAITEVLCEVESKGSYFLLGLYLKVEMQVSGWAGAWTAPRSSGRRQVSYSSDWDTDYR